MLERLLTSVIGGLISSVMKAITDWINKNELEALKAKEAALQGKIESMKQAGADEKKIAKAADEVAKVNQRSSTLGQRLKAIADAAEAKANAEAADPFQ
jgi:uncharacterized membrane protein (DUF106 family)